MHVVCSQETVVAAHSRDDKGWGVRCEAEEGLGGGRGWVGVVGALAISFESQRRIILLSHLMFQ